MIWYLVDISTGEVEFDIDWIKIELSDTDYRPYGVPWVSSRGRSALGSARHSHTLALAVF